MGTFPDQSFLISGITYPKEANFQEWNFHIVNLKYVGFAALKQPETV